MSKISENFFLFLLGKKHGVVGKKRKTVSPGIKKAPSYKRGYKKGKQLRELGGSREKY